MIDAAASLLVDDAVPIFVIIDQVIIDQVIIRAEDADAVVADW